MDQPSSNASWKLLWNIKFIVVKVNFLGLRLDQSKKQILLIKFPVLGFPRVEGKKRKRRIRRRQKAE